MYAAWRTLQERSRRSNSFSGMLRWFFIASFTLRRLPVLSVFPVFFNYIFFILQGSRKKYLTLPKILVSFFGGREFIKV